MDNIVIGSYSAIHTFSDINSRSHSVSDMMINFVFSLLMIGMVYTIIGYFTEVKPQIYPRSDE